MIQELQGDLFDLPEDYVFAHCISVDAVMGAGIAAEFVHRYPDIRDSIYGYRHIPRLGMAIPYIGHDRVVYNLITKRKVSENYSRVGDFLYVSLEQTLLDLRKQCIKLGFYSIGLPRIGCGLDGLNWNKVKPIIEKVFDERFDIQIRYL